MKKEITINSNLLKALIIGLFCGVILTFAIEHTGKFTFYLGSGPNDYGSYDIVYRDGKNKASGITFNSPFGTKTTLDSGDWKNYDVSYLNGDFYKYSNVSKYYLKATVLSDYLYTLLFSLGFGTVIFIFLNYKIKIKK